MNPITEKQLERMLRAATEGAELNRAVEGVLDRAERDGLIDVAYTEIDSPFGKMMIAGSERGILRVAFPHRRFDEILEQIAERISPRVLEAPGRLDEPRRQLDEYFEGKRREFDLPLDWRLTHGFQNRAQHAIARIPYGETRTYSWIAEKAGNPRAYRAAGTACGANVLPPIVPCHRVVPAGGGIGNYGGGPEMKRALLELEGAVQR
jgi:methylated-DNA-[protein]-cysteine S-methyltransferase